MLADRYVYTALARDAVRGVDRDWVQEIYCFALKPDLTFYFELLFEISLNGILKGRPTRNYHEAGLDMGWRAEEYAALKQPFNFIPIDATQEIHAQ